MNKVFNVERQVNGDTGDMCNREIKANLLKDKALKRYPEEGDIEEWEVSSVHTDREMASTSQERKACDSNEIQSPQEAVAIPAAFLVLFM